MVLATPRSGLQTTIGPWHRHIHFKKLGASVSRLGLAFGLQETDSCNTANCSDCFPGWVAIGWGRVGGLSGNHFGRLVAVGLVSFS